eukprot:1572143-Amphidinium_carterae.1
MRLLAEGECNLCMVLPHQPAAQPRGSSMCSTVNRVDVLTWHCTHTVTTRYLKYPSALIVPQGYNLPEA